MIDTKELEQLVFLKCTSTSTPARQLKELKAGYEQLLNTFQHVHISNPIIGDEDTCAQCGLNIRNPIHLRIN